MVQAWGNLEGTWGFAKGSETFWKQHGPRLTPDGTLLLSSHFADGQYDLVAREYRLDEEAEELEEIWSCGGGSGIEVRYAGEAYRLPGGNTLLNYGPEALFREYAPDCSVAWELVWPEGSSLRRTAFPASLYDLAP